MFDELDAGRLHEGSIYHESNRDNQITEMVDTSCP